MLDSKSGLTINPILSFACCDLKEYSPSDILSMKKFVTLEAVMANKKLFLGAEAKVYVKVHSDVELGQGRLVYSQVPNCKEDILCRLVDEIAYSNILNVVHIIIHICLLPFLNDL